MQISSSQINVNDETHKSNSTLRQKFIVVAGNIGSGKTTLTELLAKQMNIQSYFESVEDNPYLEDFYKDMKRWSFPLQVYFLNHRFATHKKIFLNKESFIQDRSIYEDANIFARALYESGEMTKRDYETYLDLFNSMIEGLSAPSVLVYLHRSIDGLMERIKQRGRDFEASISRDYIQSLSDYYEDWFERYNLGPKIKVHTDELDFLARGDDLTHLVKEIEAKTSTLSALSLH